MDSKKILLVAFRLCVSRDYRLLRRLGIFDPGYYLHCRALQRCGDPDSLWAFWIYLHADRTWEKMLRSGPNWLPRPEPHPLFDTCYYLCRYFPQGLAENPFGNYLRQGWRKGYQPGPYFDQESYRQASGWHEGLGDPLTHYTHHGAPRGIRPGPFFDVEWYLDRNPVLVPARGFIVKHYKMYGAYEGKSPVPVFSPKTYLAQLADPTNARHDPLAHYLTTAAEGELRPAEWFEPSSYRVRENLVNGRLPPFGDYLQRGVFQQRYPDSRVEALPEKPQISLLVPVYKPDLGALNNCIRSVLYQAYPHWQLCLVDDGSTIPEVTACLRGWAARDKRIRVSILPGNQGIARATNAAAQLAEGEYYGFLDNDDELTVDSLYHLVAAINRSGADLLYSDEDLIGEDGRRFSVFHKPDFNRELLFCHNYITHFVAIRATLFQSIGGLDPDCDGAQDYDLLLRASENCLTLQHIPKVLYHWRAAATSTSINHQGKPYAHAAGRRALERALDRRKMAAKVLDTEHNFFYRIAPQPPETQPGVAVLIYDRGGLWTRERLLALREKTAYPTCRFLLVDSRADTAGQEENAGVAIPPPAAGYGRALVLHQAIIAAEEEYIAILDGQVVDLDPAWLGELVSWFADNPPGIACGRVLYDKDDGPSFTLPDLDNTSTVYYAAFLTRAS
ncbi:MAG TPA: glycosyltransferase, partial [Desulforhopalus sp.]|nr:glycosyltransferase [Desulforhopalus sp.]